MKKLSDYISLHGKIETISATEFRKHFGECLNQAACGKTFIIKRKNTLIVYLGTPAPSIEAEVESLGFKVADAEIKAEVPTKRELQALMDGHTFLSLLDENVRLKIENKKLFLMVENGLGFEDLENDITYPAER